MIRVALGVDDDESRLSESHFGDSKLYLIYEVVEDGSYRLVERRLNRAREMEESEHGDPRKFRAVAKLLEDVDVFLAGRMGPNYLRLRESRFYPIVVGKKTVEEALEILVSRLDEVMDEVKRRRRAELRDEG